jgi:hypothetical protein
MKVKFNLDAVRDFFIYHGEKVAVGLVGLVFLWCLVRAVTISGRTVDFTPSELENEAASAANHIEQSQPGESSQLTDYLAIAKRIRDKIDETFYRHEVLWDPPLWERRGLRGEPPVFGLERIRAVAGNGVFNMVDPTAPPTSAARTTTPTRGQRWVVVTGLIPIARQIEAYQEAFGKAIYRDPQRDHPLYLHYWVERAEVNPRSDSSQLRWVRIDPRLMLWYFVRLWRGAAQEVVHPVYIPRSAPQATPLIFPLGPRVGEAWGPEVAFPPEIPLAAAIRGPLAGTPEAGGYPAGMPAYPGTPGGSTVAMAYPGPMPYPGMGYPGGEEMYGESGYPGSPAGYPGPGGPSYGGMPSVPGLPMPGAPGGGIVPPIGDLPGLPGLPGVPTQPTSPQGQPTAPAQPAPQPGLGTPGTAVPGGIVPSAGTIQVKHQLFRFFDFTVEPGKQYVYRVQLVLFNPNYRLDPQYLERPELSEQPWLETQWSDATEPVLVPMDARLVVGPVKPAPTVLHEPQANVVILAFRSEDGLRTYQDFTVFRGQLANLEGVVNRGGAGPGYPGATGMYPGSSGLEELYASPETLAPPGAPGGPPTARPGTTARTTGQKTEEEKFLYKTEMLVLDIAGGRRLHRTDAALTEPGELLVMDPNGSLIVLEEISHEKEYKLYHKEPEQPAKRPATGRPEGPGSYMAEMPEEYYDTYMAEYYETGRGGRGRGRGTARTSRGPAAPGAGVRRP